MDDRAPISIRPAGPADAETVHRFVQALADYEREPDAVEATPDVYRRQLAEDPPPFRCLLAEEGGEPRGFALFFSTYSTWKGRPGVWLEDLFVPSEHRGRGIGERLLRAVAAEAVARGAGRLEWAVLDWNEPAIGFYRSLGSVAMDEWTTHRVSGEALLRLGGGDRPGDATRA